MEGCDTATVTFYSTSKTPALWGSDRIEHSAWRIAKRRVNGKLVNGEQSLSQRMIGLPFTVYHTLCALRLALCVKGAFQSRGLWVWILYYPLRAGY